MSESPDRGAILHGETRIEYTVVRSRRRRRTIGITLEDGGGVVVRAPLRASRAMVGEVVQRKAGWIARKLEEIAQRPGAADERGWDAGARPPVWADWVHGKQRGSTEGRASGPEGYELYRERALVVLQAAVERRAAEMGCSPSRVLVRNQKRQWGSCARDGTLRFNWRLVMLAPSLIDYVVVHELTHLRVRNHSREFWSAVAAVLPDFKERRARLREARLL